MSARVIYIAGPMTGLPDFNYEAFHEAAAQLAGEAPDAEIINPAENFEGEQGLPYEVYIRKSIEQVLTATELYVLPGWERSRGARLEVLVAQMLGLDVKFGDTLKEVAK